MAVPVDDTLTLIINGMEWSGWEEVQVTRGVERCPSDFDLKVTERYPTAPLQIDIEPGQSCTVQLGADVVLTGYIDRYTASIAPNDHTVRIRGRSRCQDLVDSAAIISGMQISGASALSLAQQLAQPFGVSVSSLSGPGPAIPQFNVVLTETVYEIVERVARYSALLVYDDANGNLVLSQVGSTMMASGFTQGINVKDASVTFSMDERFSEYIAVVMAVDKYNDVGTSGNQIQTITDPTVTRLRRKIIVSEQGMSSLELAAQRAQWEKARRFGRSQAVRLTTDSWRDSAGTLWQPNALAPLSLPALKIGNVNWVISEVTYSRSGEGAGTTASLLLMPPEAFQPEPDILQLYDWQIAKDLASATVDATSNIATGAAGR